MNTILKEDVVMKDRETILHHLDEGDVFFNEIDEMKLKGMIYPKNKIPHHHDDGP